MKGHQEYLAGELREVFGDAELEDGLPAYELAAVISVRVLSGSLYTRGNIARIESKVRRDEARRVGRTIRLLPLPDSVRETFSEAVYLASLDAAAAVAKP